MANIAKRRLLILGAGIMQGPAIRHAKDLGLETVAVDGDPGAPLASEADRFENVDLKDIRAIERLARRLQADGGLHGVMTAGTDFSASVAWTAEKLGLPGIPYETALDASDKERMRRRFEAAGLPSPAFRVFTEVPGSESERTSGSEALPFPFPAVVKPVDNMGARGCRRVDNPAQLREAVGAALAFSRTRRAIAEAYLPGPEFSVDALIYRGEVTICGLADRHIFFPPFFIEMGHTMPAACSGSRERTAGEADKKAIEKAIIDVFIRGIRALGIGHGAAKGDIKLSPAGPFIGEIAARLSGGYMSGWTYPYASGAEPVRGAIRIALGEPPGIKALRRWTSAERAFISIPGLVQSVEGLDQARRVPGIKDLFLRAGPGKRLSFPENNVSKAGNVISAGPDRENAIGAAEKAARTVLIRLAAPDSETEAFLSGPPGPGSPDSAPLFPPPAYTADPALLSGLSALPETRNAFNTPGLDSRRETPAVYAVPFPAFTESNLRDYQGRTPAETLDAIRALTGLALPPAPDNRRNASYAAAPATESGTVVLGREFWTALIRGGYQGAVYYIDRLLGAAAANAPGETP